jgi:hypothetical protein
VTITRNGQAERLFLDQTPVGGGGAGAMPIGAPQPPQMVAPPQPVPIINTMRPPAPPQPSQNQ